MNNILSTCDHELCRLVHEKRHTEFLEIYNKNIFRDSVFKYSADKFAIAVVIYEKNDTIDNAGFVIKTIDDYTCVICTGSCDAFDDKCYIRSAIESLRIEYGVTISVQNFIDYSQHMNEYFVPIVMDDLIPIFFIRFQQDDFLSLNKSFKYLDVLEKISKNNAPSKINVSSKISIMNWNTYSNFYLTISPEILKSKNDKSLLAMSTMLWSKKFCHKKLIHIQ